MVRAVVSQLEALLRRSFDGENTQSLMQNISDVRPGDWDWVPPDGRRSIRTIFEHAVIAKHIYTEFLFGEARPSWDEVAARCPSDVDALLAWAREGHAAFMRGMATLQDGDLADMTTKWHGAPRYEGGSHRGDDPAQLLPRRRDQPHPRRPPEARLRVGRQLPRAPTPQLPASSFQPQSVRLWGSCLAIPGSWL